MKLNECSLVAGYRKLGACGFVLVHALLLACSESSISGPGKALPASSTSPPGSVGVPVPTGSMTAPPPGGTLPTANQGDVVRRLSRTELDATLADLLGDTSAPAGRFLAEDSFTPFDNDTGRQQASAALIESLEAMATDSARKVLADPALRSNLVPCVPSGVTDVGCFTEVVQTLGRRAYRRAFEAPEVARYLPILTLVQNEGQAVQATFDTAVELVIRSFVQDPEFLYRIEVGTPAPFGAGAGLNSFEVATRLSYLLWGTMPDQALLAAAERSELLTPASRQAEALRLFEDPKARGQWYRFHAMWLGYRSIPQSAQLASALIAETNRLIDRAAFENADYTALFQSNQTYLDTALATHYGLPAPAGGAGWVTYPETSGRAGILAHGSVLSGFSKFSDTSPTQRGILVRTRLMCDEIPPPPPIVDVDKPPVSAAGSNCKIDRYAAHREIASCAACHEGMDLIGFGLENFDIAGRHRDFDDGHPECAIAGQGTVPELGAFQGPKELSLKLTTAQKIEMCMAQHFNAFALGRARVPTDAALVTPLVERFRGSGYSFKDLVLDYVASAAFGLKKEGVAP